MSNFSSRRRKIVNYLSNKELLKEIHRSKSSYCEFVEPKYADYDIIVDSLSVVKGEVLEQAKVNRANRLNEIAGDLLFNEGYSNKEIESELKKTGVKASQFKKENIVVRVLTNEHIPEVKDKKDKIIKYPVNFPPFQHFIFQDKAWVLVGQSHYKDGKFAAARHGNATRKLALAYLKIVDRYANKGNWRGYSWLDEMKGQAIARLVQSGLSFNEHRSDNPFAYFTTIINNSFTRVLNKEKELLSTKSKLIQDVGYSASFGEQADHDINNYHMSSKPKLVKDDD